MKDLSLENKVIRVIKWYSFLNLDRKHYFHESARYRDLAIWFCPTTGLADRTRKEYREVHLKKILKKLIKDEVIERIEVKNNKHIIVAYRMKS